jgi:hypothetical protein
MFNSGRSQAIAATQLQNLLQGAGFPQVPEIGTGLRNALEMLRGSKQPPGDYLVILKMNGEVLPEMFVAANQYSQPRVALSEKLNESFPDLKMGIDVFCMPVVLQ